MFSDADLIIPGTMSSWIAPFARGAFAFLHCPPAAFRVRVMPRKAAYGLYLAALTGAALAAVFFGAGASTLPRILGAGKGRRRAGGSTGSGVIVGTVDTVVPGSTPMVISAPIDTAMPEPVTVTLTSVRLGTTQVWDADGTVWLLPAYVFSGTDTGDVTVIAVDEAYLDIPEVPVPDVMPPVSAPPALGNRSSSVAPARNWAAC